MTSPPTSIPSHGEADPRVAIAQTWIDAGGGPVRELFEILDAYMASQVVISRAAAALHDFNERESGTSLPFEALSPSGKEYRRRQARAALRAVTGGE